MHLYLCRDGVSCRLFIWRPPYTLKHLFSRYLTLQQQKSEVVTSKLYAGADPGFQVRGGAHLKNCAERREARNLFGYNVWKITYLRQKIIFFPILGCPPLPPGSAPGYWSIKLFSYILCDSRTIYTFKKKS
jgi:hypothetical protein